MTEMHYRRLLALYPRDFRREYEEEMLAVLMTDERRGPAQVLDVIRAALVVRFRLVAGAAEWRQAARIVQLFGAILLFAVALRRLVGLARTAILHPEFVPFRPDLVDGTRAAAWAVVVIAALLGWRLLGFAGAAAGLAGEIASPARYYYDTPATVLHVYWLIVAAAVVLVAGLVACRSGNRPRGWLAVVAAGAVLSSLNVVPWEPRTAWTGLLIVAGAFVLLGVIRQEPVMRRWMLAWAAPVLVTVPLIRTGFGDFIEHNMSHPEALRLIAPYQWVALVLVPVAAFLTVAELNRRRGFGQPEPGQTTGA